MFKKGKHAQPTAIIQLERDPDPDVYGHYAFRITGIRNRNWADKIMFYINRVFVKPILRSGNQLFNINVLINTIPCVLEVYPSKAMQDKLFYNTPLNFNHA